MVESYYAGLHDSQRAILRQNLTNAITAVSLLGVNEGHYLNEPFPADLREAANLLIDRLNQL